MSTHIPNLFHYAQSELSQDAFISWLMAWAHPDHSENGSALNECGTHLLREFFSKWGHDMGSIKDLVMYTQFHNMDILCLVETADGGKYGVIIEDKTGTKDHSDQLKRYVDILKDKKPDYAPVPIYFKTGNENRSETKGSDHKFKTFYRDEFLNILNQYKDRVPNEIFLDYCAHMQGQENITNSYSTLPVCDWSWFAIQGFYEKLRTSLADTEVSKSWWKYIPNQTGGFLGFITPDRVFAQWGGGTLYVQIEGNASYDSTRFKMCVKYYDEKKPRIPSWKKSDLIEAINARLSLAVMPDLALRKPGRFGSGVSMTIGLVCDNEQVLSLPRQDDGMVEMEKTKQLLVELMRVIDEICSQSNCS